MCGEAICVFGASCVCSFAVSAAESVMVLIIDIIARGISVDFFVTSASS